MKKTIAIVGLAFILIGLFGCEKEESPIKEITTMEDFGDFKPNWHLTGYTIYPDTFMGSGFAYINMEQMIFTFTGGIIPYGLIGRYQKRHYPIAKIELSESTYRVTLKTPIEYEGGQANVIFFNEYVIMANTGARKWKAWIDGHRYNQIIDFNN